MSRPVLLVALAAASAAALTALAPTASACSPAVDWAAPPEAELDYDPAEAPAEPQPVAATIRRYEDVGGGCGTSSCGDLTYLKIELAAMPEPARVRVLHPDGTVVYAQPWQRGDGSIGFQVFWDEDAAPATVMLETVTDAGYPSLPVTIGAVEDPANAEASGCAVSSELPSAGALLWAAATLLALRRRYGKTR